MLAGWHYCYTKLYTVQMTNQVGILVCSKVSFIILDKFCLGDRILASYCLWISLFIISDDCNAIIQIM